MLSHLGGVARVAAGTLLRRGRPDRLEVRGQRNLGVDDDLSPARQVHDHVGAQTATTLPLDGDLLAVIAVLGQAGQLDHAV